MTRRKIHEWFWYLFNHTISSTEWKINPWEEPCWRSTEQI